VGFSSIAAYMILFFSVIILVGSMVMIYGRMVDSSTLAYSVQQERLEQISQTRIDMESAEYAGGIVRINVTNLGGTKLSIDYIDAYIDGVKIPRETANRTIEFAPDSLVVNPLLWDPYETIVLVINHPLEPGQHRAAVSTDSGIVVEKVFSA
jgi:archaellum component FlaF (FlaF/FlaG flagellin family)